MSWDNKILPTIKGQAVEVAYNIMVPIFLMVCWAMNLTALPGILFLWWLKKQGLLLGAIKNETLILLGRNQWIISLLFLACFLMTSEMEKEIKHNALSEDHFLPILTMLPGFLAYGLKALAMVSLVLNIVLLIRGKIIKR